MNPPVLQALRFLTIRRFARRQWRWQDSVLGLLGNLWQNLLRLLGNGLLDHRLLEIYPRDWLRITGGLGLEREDNCILEFENFAI